MKNIVNISIAGISFTATSEAYDQLRSYLKSLESGYKSNPDGTEIITDIEARIVELILSKQSRETIVSTAVVEDVIDQLGPASEIGGDGFEQQSKLGEHSEGDEGTFPRRLYRYSEGAKLGGVCNGVGIFLDIDPTWIRLSMFAPLVLLIILPSIGFHPLNGFMGSLFGSIMLLYFVLWVVVPLARSPRQKLEMRGKKITLSSIQSGAGEQESPMSQQIERSSSIMSQLFVTFGRIILLLTKCLIIFIGFILSIVVIAMFAVITGIILGSDIGNSDSFMRTYGIFANMNGISLNGYVALLFGVVSIPLAVLVYCIVKFVFKLPHNPKIAWIFGGIWLILLVYACAIAVNNADVIRDNIESVTIKYPKKINRIYRHKRRSESAIKLHSHAVPQLHSKSEAN